MSQGHVTRQRLIETAARLFESRGYAATGLNQIIEEAGAPRGSLYFHFRGGKEHLAEDVVANYARGWTEVLREVSRVSPTAIAAATSILDILVERFERTRCEGGCPVTSIAIEMANRSDKLRAAVRAAYESWAGVVRDKLEQEGFSAAESQPRARVAVAAIEGALILARAYGNADPLRDLKELLPVMLRR